MNNGFKSQLGAALIVFIALLFGGFSHTVEARNDNVVAQNEQGNNDKPDRPDSDNPDDDSVIVPDPGSDIPRDDNYDEDKTPAEEEQPEQAEQPAEEPKRTESATEARPAAPAPDDSSVEERIVRAPSTGPSDELPETGIGSVLSTVAGIGAIAGSSYYYRQSLVAQRNAIFRRDK